MFNYIFLMEFPFLYRSFPTERYTLNVLVLTITFCHSFKIFEWA